MAFTAPLIDFGFHEDSDDGDFYDINLDPSTVSAKKKWKKLYQVVMDNRTQIPLKQMLWKTKH